MNRRVRPCSPFCGLPFGIHNRRRIREAEAFFGFAERLFSRDSSVLGDDRGTDSNGLGNHCGDVRTIVESISEAYANTKIDRVKRISLRVACAIRNEYMASLAGDSGGVNGR